MIAMTIIQWLRLADDNITRNYMETCYAQETNLTLGLSSTNITFPGSDPALTQFLYYNPVEDDGTADSGESEHNFTTPITSPISLPSLPIENIASSFPADAPDGNGTTHIEYKLNFDRKLNLVVNPFKMVLSDVNISDEDNVTGSATETAGTALLNQNATMYYARTRSSKFFYDDVTGSSKQTPITIDVYCDFGYTICPNLGIDTSNAQINEINWWLSLGHDASSFEDGNVTLQIVTSTITPSGATASVAPTNVRITPSPGNTPPGGIDTNVTVTADTDERPMTVPIQLVNRIDTSTPGYVPLASPYTNHWLIYNEESATEVPSPFYKVRFIGISDWAGHGDTGNVVESNASTKKNRRLGW